MSRVSGGTECIMKKNSTFTKVMAGVLVGLMIVSFAAMALMYILSA